MCEQVTKRRRPRADSAGGVSEEGWRSGLWRWSRRAIHDLISSNSARSVSFGASCEGKNGNGRRQDCGRVVSGSFYNCDLEGGVAVAVRRVNLGYVALINFVGCQVVGVGRRVRLAGVAVAVGDRD